MGFIEIFLRIKALFEFLWKINDYLFIILNEIKSLAEHYFMRDEKMLNQNIYKSSWWNVEHSIEKQKFSFIFHKIIP